MDYEELLQRVRELDTDIYSLYEYVAEADVDINEELRYIEQLMNASDHLFKHVKNKKEGK